MNPPFGYLFRMLFWNTHYAYSTTNYTEILVIINDNIFGRLTLKTRMEYFSLNFIKYIYQVNYLFSFFVQMSNNCCLLL